MSMSSSSSSSSSSLGEKESRKNRNRSGRGNQQHEKPSPTIKKSTRDNSGNINDNIMDIIGKINENFFIIKSDNKSSLLLDKEKNRSLASLVSIRSVSPPPSSPKYLPLSKSPFSPPNLPSTSSSSSPPPSSIVDDVVNLIVNNVKGGSNDAAGGTGRSGSHPQLVKKSSRTSISSKSGASGSPSFRNRKDKELYSFNFKNNATVKSPKPKELKSNSLMSLNDEPERLISCGLLVWSHRFTDLSGLRMVDNYIAPYEPDPPLYYDDEQFLPTDFCDFVFPILIGSPDNIPLDQSWVKKVPSIMKPGCYLICARPKQQNYWTEADRKVKIVLYRTDLEAKIPRLDANLLFLMHSVCRTDTNLNVTEFVDHIDDMDSMKGHYFPHRLSQNMYQLLAPKQVAQYPRQYLPPRPRTHLQKYVDELIREPSDESLRDVTGLDLEKSQPEVIRILKRHTDLVYIFSEHRLSDLYKLRETFVTERPKDDRNFYSERFNFFLSQDSYGVILDQNCAFDKFQWKIVRDLEEKSRPFVRLIRSGDYIAIEGSPRYCNLSNAGHTFYTRSTFLCRLTSFPMIIIQEGIKCFDAYYNNDGLDFTYFDSIRINDLIYIDWYQIQIDLKMDDRPRIFKGHLMFWDEMNDLLATLRFSHLKFDYDMAARVNMLYMEDENELENQATAAFRPLIVFTLQQVTYTYFDLFKSRLEILWNVFFRIDETHITNEKVQLNVVTNPAYFYMKSFNCIYTWTQKDRDSPYKEDKDCEITISSSDVSELDLSKIGWSRAMFEQYLIIYLGRLYPYQKSLKQWLQDETRKVKRQLIVRPTTLTDKLLYRNQFFTMKCEQFQKEQAQKPKKWFLNLKKTSPGVMSNSDDEEEQKQPHSQAKSNKSEQKKTLKIDQQQQQQQKSLQPQQDSPVKKSASQSKKKTPKSPNGEEGGKSSNIFNRKF